MSEENKQGTKHPLSILADQAHQAFADMGFEIALGPEMESEWYNFDILNMPKDHQEKVLRTHTTGVTAWATEQAAKAGRIPSAFISVGKVFRNEATDNTHEMQFFQIDGSMLGTTEDGVSLVHMMAVLRNFYKKMLGPDVEIEFRPSFFPF